MARIAGINIPLNKRAEIGLTYIYGVGRPTANEILRKTNIEPDRKVRDLTEDEVSRLREAIDEITVEGDDSSQEQFGRFKLCRDDQGSPFGLHQRPR